MTTAHRATFTHAKAKDTSLSQTYQASLTHKRALAGHTQLKYRTKSQIVNNNDTNTLKEKLLRKENEHFKKIGRSFPNESTNEGQKLIENNNNNNTYQMDMDSDDGEEFDENKTPPTESILDTISDSEEDDDDNLEEDDDEGDGSDDSEDSDDETEQLLLELAKIKNERKSLQEQKKELETQEEARTSNPLLDYSENVEDSTNLEAPKRSWRDSTLFSNKKRKIDQPDNNIDNYTNDMLKSDFHKKFLDRYVK